MENPIAKCLKLFELTPTTPNYRWLIAADWLEEENKYTESNAFRENVFVLEIANANGHASGYGNGRGHGYGWGFGSGNGEGEGNGTGNGEGSSSGWGNG